MFLNALYEDFQISDEEIEKETMAVLTFITSLLEAPAIFEIYFKIYCIYTVYLGASFWIF